MQKLKHYCLWGVASTDDHIQNIPEVSKLTSESKLIAVINKPDVGCWRFHKTAINDLIRMFNILWAKY